MSLSSADLEGGGAVADDAQIDGDQADHASLARLFASRLDPRALSRLPTTVLFSVITADAGYSIAVEIAKDGVRVVDGVGRADVTVSFESSTELADVATGRLQLMSVLRTGRAALDVPDRTNLVAVLSMAPGPEDPAPSPAGVYDLPVRAVSMSDKDLRKLVKQRGIGPFVEHYARCQAEALDRSDVRSDLPSFAVEFRVDDEIGRAGYTITIGPDTCEVAPDRPSDMAMVWTSATDFLRYLARQLDFRDAILNGSAHFDGDRDIAGVFYEHIGRHGV